MAITKWLLSLLYLFSYVRYIVLWSELYIVLCNAGLSVQYGSVVGGCGRARDDAYSVDAWPRRLSLPGMPQPVLAGPT